MSVSLIREFEPPKCLTCRGILSEYVYIETYYESKYNSVCEWLCDNCQPRLIPLMKLRDEDVEKEVAKLILEDENRYKYRSPEEEEEIIRHIASFVRNRKRGKWKAVFKAIFKP